MLAAAAGEVLLPRPVGEVDEGTDPGGALREAPAAAGQRGREPPDGARSFVDLAELNHRPLGLQQVAHLPQASLLPPVSDDQIQMVGAHDSGAEEVEAP